jgi:excisionase family DNA binding protein
MNKQDIYITTQTASEILGVNPRTVQEWCKLQKIPSCVKLGRRWLINKYQMLHWIKEQEQRVNPVWLLPKYQRV